jgi:alginate O-acetyltransferase complex protein AlgI
MSFSSVEFALFFVIFFFVYWLVFKHKVRLQNLFLLIGSYVFYAWWNWHFLFLLIGSSVLNYFLGIAIYRAKGRRYRKILLGIGLFVSVGLLIYFKYVNFFISSLAQSLVLFKINTNFHSLHIILPLGISFYTFRIISYLLDVEKNKIKPVNDWLIFLTYVAFFPSLISGPIDRAGKLVPQLTKKRVFDYYQMRDGFSQIIWGLFKKLVIADNLALLIKGVFENYAILPASSLLVGAFCFAIQVYADFSGYSDMAIGLSRLLGFDITRNFNFPFYSQNIAEYWRKWHISLTAWMTDYIFTPLNIEFRNYGKFGLILAILINFTIIGIWHGANWTFVFFGFINGCCYIPLILKGTIFKTKRNSGNLIPSWKEFRNMLGTFLLVIITDILFKAENISQAVDFWKHLFSASIFSIPLVAGNLSNYTTFSLIFIMLIIEWIQRNRQHGLQIDYIKSKILRIGIYYLLIFSIIYWHSADLNQFIYFKF